MKFFSSQFLFLGVLILPLLSHAGGKNPRTNEYVGATWAVERTRLAAGSSGRLRFTLRPKKDIHINLRPPLSVSLEGDSSITLTGDPKLSSVKKDTSEYLDASKPVLQAFTLSRNARPGSARITGTLTYFYCSDSEGWCSRFRQPFEAKVTVVK